MNILHFFSKLNFTTLWHLDEKTVLIFTGIMILLDMAYFWFIFPLFSQDRRKGLIPYYNWYIVFKRFWNTHAFWEHIAIEIFGMLFPILVIEHFHNPVVVIILSIIDLIVCVLGIRHHWEINEKMFEEFHINRKLLFTCLIFDLSLLLIIIRGRKLD